MQEKHEEKEPVGAQEFEAKTIEEAIEAAVAALKVPREKIKVQILTEGQRGLFGMEGAKKAKIRVTVLSD